MENIESEESAVVRKYSGKFGWPTVVLAFALLGIDVGVVVLWAQGSVPMWLGFVITSVVAYCFYTVHHDATHKSISGRSEKLRWIEQLCGNIAGLVMILDFTGYAGSHLRHHAHVNTAKDPDISVKGSLAEMPRKWVLGTVFNIIGALPRGPKMVAKILMRMGVDVSGARSEREIRDAARIRRMFQFSLFALVVSIPFGLFVPLFVFWWASSRVGIFALMILFQWLPHVPFDRTDRFGATRVNRFFGSTWLLLQQDYHLIHHLYPSIPWYRYRAAFTELEPFLIRNGAKIEGRGSQPFVPIAR